MLPQVSDIEFEIQYAYSTYNALGVHLCSGPITVTGHGSLWFDDLSLKEKDLEAMVGGLGRPLSRAAETRPGHVSRTCPRMSTGGPSRAAETSNSTTSRCVEARRNTPCGRSLSSDSRAYPPPARVLQQAARNAPPSSAGWLQVGGICSFVSSQYKDGFARPDLLGMACNGFEAVNHNPFSDGWHWVGPGERPAGLVGKVQEFAKKSCGSVDYDMNRRCMFTDGWEQAFNLLPMLEQLGAANPSFDSEAHAQVGDKAKKATPWH